MKGMMKFIIARTNTEIGYINVWSVDIETILEWIMTDKKEWNRYKGQGLSIQERDFLPFFLLDKYCISILSDTISHLNSKNEKIYGIKAF